MFDPNGNTVSQMPNYRMTQIYHPTSVNISQRLNPKLVVDVTEHPLAMEKNNSTKIVQKVYLSKKH
jgi:hypothetical protein